MKKRILTLVLCLVMLASCFMVMPAQAEDTLDSHLTIHWDFEGNTTEERLKDKATAGESQDDLHFNHANGFPFDFENNGTIYQFQNVSNNYGYAVVANSSTDLVNASKTYGTWFLRVSATTAAEYNLIAFRNTKGTHARPFFVSIASNGVLNNVAIGTDTNANVKNFNNWFNTGYQFDGQSLNLAFVFRDDEYGDNDHIWCYVYASIGDAPLTKLGRGDTGVTQLASSADINFGLFQEDYQKWPTNGSLHYDDVRFYDISLTETQLNEILSTEFSTKTANNAYQYSAVKDGTYSLRLIATIDANDIPDGAGLNITVGTKTTKCPVTACYSTLLAKDDDGSMTEVNAPEGKYFIAVVINGIPETELPTLTVKPYVVKDGVTYSGTASTIKVTK